MQEIVPLFLAVVLCVRATVPHPRNGEEVCEQVIQCENGEGCLSTPSEEPAGLTCPCHPNPCHNGGVCESRETQQRGDALAGYLCRCPHGFDGGLCQNDVNECAKNPCKNGGICTDLEANYTCECPGEYMGRNCQYSEYLKLPTCQGRGVAMLSKQGSRSSLRSSFKALTKPTRSQTSLSLDNGDLPDGSIVSSAVEQVEQAPSVDHKTVETQTDNDLEVPWVIESEVKPPRKGTCTSEDRFSLCSRTSTSTRIEGKDGDVSFSCRSRDTSFIDNKDVALNRSVYPDTPNESKLTKDCLSEADTLSVNGTIDSRIIDDLSPIKTKPCCECSGPLGMEGGIISNQQITASSTQRAMLGLQKWYPYFARLNRKGIVNAWSAAENDHWPWIQINLLRQMRLTGVITQGAKRMGKPEYVKSYKVAFSEDGETWTMFIDRGTNGDMEFSGNSDNNSPSANSFTPPIEAQYIRIYPQVCRGHCTLRMELLGCELTGCSEPMGMKTGHIQDFQISSSSIYQTLHMDNFSWEPSKARLDKQGRVNAWASAASDQSQWLQVDMLLPTKVTGIITQGAKDFGRVQFVGSFKVAFSNDGEKWTVYQDESQQKDKLWESYRAMLYHTARIHRATTVLVYCMLMKVFQGNFDNETHRKNVMDPPIYARFVRIIPWSWYGRIALRTELLGCTEEEE